MRGRFILFMVAFALLMGRAQAGGDTGETAYVAENAAAESVAAAPLITGTSVVTAAAAATEPILLSIPDAGGLRITVGTGNVLHAFVAGKTVPNIPTSKVVNLHVTAGYVDGGTFTISGDHAWNNLFGTGLNFKIKSGTTLTVTATGIELAASGGGGVSLVLPLTDTSANATGNKLEVDVAPLDIARNGAIKIDAKLTRQVQFNIPGGFSIGAQSLEVVYAHNPGGSDDDAKITMGKIQITTPVPGILTQNPAPLTLYADTASVNTDGQVTCAGASLKQSAATAAAGKDADDYVQVASRKGFAVKPKARRRIGPSFPIKIPLIAPADFVIKLMDENAVKLDLANNIPTGFTITCDVELPSVFTTTAAGTGTDRVTAHKVALDIDIKKGGFTAKLPTDDQPGKVLTAYFKGFGVQISDAAIDLSDTKSIAYPAGAPVPGGKETWEGIYIAKAVLVPPDDMTINDDSGALLPLTITNCWIDNHGFTGDVELKAGDGGPGTSSKGSVTIGGFLVKLDDFKVSIDHSSIKDCNIDGSLTITSLTVPKSATDSTPVPAKITVAASVSDSGLASLQVQTSVIPLNTFQADMQIEKGTLQHDPDKNRTVLSLTGTWAFRASADSTVAGLKVQVNGLQIDNQGKFALDSVWIDMPESASLDCDLVTLHARQIGFGNIGTGGTPWVGFNGDVGVGGDLPVQAKADFEGLYVYADGHVRVGRINIDCNVKKVLHVVGYLEQTEGTLTRTIYTDNAGTHSNIGPDGKFLHEDAGYQVDPAKLTLSDGRALRILSGMVKVQLPILGGGADADGDDDADSDDDDSSSGGPGGMLQFMIARNCWFVMGSFSNTNPLILLGDSGVAIYGFGGGVGYNVKSEFAGATGTPAVDYQVIPDVAAIEGAPSASGLPNIIAVIAARIGTAVVPAPVWGDVILIADIGKLTFTVEGNCYLADTMPTEVPALPSNDLDRVLHTSISFNGTSVPKTFLLDGYADLCLPKKTQDAQGKDTTLIRLYAPFRVKIGKGDTSDTGFIADSNNRVFYAKLGGPVDLGAETSDSHGVKAHRNVTISNPVTLTIHGLQPIQGAISLDANSGDFYTAFRIHQPLHVDSGGDQQIDVFVGTINYKYTLDGVFDATGWLHVQFPGIDSTHVGGLSASGEFYFYTTLNGSASDLKFENWIHDIKISDIGISATLEADLQGSLTPSSLNISGQVYADVGFKVYGHDLSLPFSAGVSWGASL